MSEPLSSGHYLLALTPLSFNFAEQTVSQSTHDSLVLSETGSGRSTKIAELALVSSEFYARAL